FDLEDRQRLTDEQVYIVEKCDEPLQPKAGEESVAIPYEFVTKRIFANEDIIDGKIGLIFFPACGFSPDQGVNVAQYAFFYFLNLPHIMAMPFLADTFRPVTPAVVIRFQGEKLSVEGSFEQIPDVEFKILPEWK